MELTDQELWHILQVEPAANPRPWERDAKPVPGTAWIEWAKAEILSGAGVSSYGDKFKLYSIYYSRLVRILDVLGECGISPTKSRIADGVTLYEESYLDALVLNGLEACGCSSVRTQNTLSLMKQDGVFTDQTFDETQYGMRPGSGRNTYYGLTFKGKRQAVTASVMPQIEETGLDERAQIDADPQACCAPPADDSMRGDTHNSMKEGVRSFEIWEGRIDHKGEVELAFGGCEGTQTEYKGIYYEDYEVGITGKKADRRQVEFRIGHIYDSVKARVLVFRQPVTSRNDAIPTAIVIGENEYHNMGIIDVWSDVDVPCLVDDYNEREPNHADMQRIPRLRQSMAQPPVESREPDIGDPPFHEEFKKNIKMIPDILQKVESGPQKTAALVQGNGKRRLGTPGTVVEEDFTASAHFTNITWRKNQYVLRQKAAVIIETLYITQKSLGLPGMHQDEVFAQIYGADKKNWPSGKTRIQNFFRQNDAKRLWDDGCIAHDGKGNFHLNIKIHT